MKYLRKSRNLRLGHDLFKRVVYSTNSFFEGDLFKKGYIFKSVVISRAYGIFSQYYGKLSRDLCHLCYNLEQQYQMIEYIWKHWLPRNLALQLETNSVFAVHYYDEPCKMNNAGFAADQLGNRPQIVGLQ